MPYVNNRWLGGLLTNWRTIADRIQYLHELRRLKNEVEKQLPKKYEHTVFCHLSKRQRFLYDDFMSRAKTR